MRAYLYISIKKHNTWLHKVVTETLNVWSLFKDFQLTELGHKCKWKERISLNRDDFLLIDWIYVIRIQLSFQCKRPLFHRFSGDQLLAWSLAIFNRPTGFSNSLMLLALFVQIHWAYWISFFKGVNEHDLAITRWIFIPIEYTHRYSLKNKWITTIWCLTLASRHCLCRF